jgi:hypothetical protein
VKRSGAASSILAVPLGVVLGLAALTSCGLPGGDTVTRVDRDQVPYHLLDPERPSPTVGTAGGPGLRPDTYWLQDDRLVPEATGLSCTDPADAVVASLLSALAAGPPSDALAEGRGSAIPPEAGLVLVGVEDGVAEVEVDPQLTISAERLPAAVGQIVLTVTSARDVRWVALVADGKPVQVPLPDGTLTAGRVGAQDYADLVPPRFRRPGRAGCSP